MGTVNFSGAGTGIDWSQLVDAQVEARTAQVITPLEDWKASWEDKIATFDDLAELLAEFRSASQAMDTRAELRSYVASSTDETAVNATASGNATAGTHTIRVNQLASGEIETHSGLDDSATIVNNSGGSLDFSYTCNGETTTLIVPDDTTLEQLVALINNDPNNPGVVASILDDGSDGTASHHLMLGSEQTGEDYTIQIEAAGTTLQGEWGDLTVDAAPGAGSVTVGDTSSFAQYQAVIIDDDDSAAEYHIISSIAGNTLNLLGTLAGNFKVAENAYATARGIGSGLSAAVAGGEDTVSVADAGLFQVGKTVIIADGAHSEQATISSVDTENNTITFDAGLSNGYAATAYVTQLEGGRKFTFEDTAFSETLTARNAEFRMDGYPPAGWIERESNTISDVIPGVTLNLLDDTDGADVTVTVTEDTSIAKEKVHAFVDAYNSVKTFLNIATDYDEEADKTGILLGNYVAGMVESQLRDVIISAAPGFDYAADSFSHLAQIGITTNGAAEERVELGTLEIDEEKLDDALADDFEAVVRLFAADFDGYSDSSLLSFYTASDMLTQPGAYDVRVTFDGSGNITAGYMKLTSETEWRQARVDLPYVVGQSGNPEDNLWVRAAWDGVSAEQTAVVRLTQGVAGRIGDVLASILDSDEGILHNVESSYRDIISGIDKRMDVEQERLDSLQERLTAKYARLEQLMVQLQGQQDWSSSIASGMGWASE